MPQEYCKNSRLCLLSDSETREEVWLRRHRLHASNQEYLQYIADTEKRGAVVPMTEEEILQFFLGAQYSMYAMEGDKLYFTDRQAPGNGKGICYHPTEDTKDSFYKDQYEAPAVGHLLWREHYDELSIHSMVVDAEFHFRRLMYRVLLDELKSFVIGAAGYPDVEKITAVVRTDLERRFYEEHAFCSVHLPSGKEVMCWQPENEGLTKTNLRSRNKKA